MNPITREEALLDGQDLTPITRKEQFIKRIYDKTQEIPEPITREEYFLKKAGEGTSPVAVEQLNVTENGTYSETGKAYSPVIVDVPAPTLITKTITENGTYNASEDNADGYSQVTVNVPYMEKKSASGDIASFSDGAGYPFLKVKANINPVQDLHGYDYPWVGGAGKNKINAPNITLADAGDIYNGAVNLAAGTYTLSSSNTTTSVTVEGVSGTMPLTFTLANAITTIQITASGAGEFKNIQIESGSSATSYAPYSNICPISGFTGVNVTVSPTTAEGSGTVYPISWQDEAGIVYGGYIDLVSGVLTVTMAGVDLGTLSWTKSSTSIFRAVVSDKKVGVSPLLCENYAYYANAGFAVTDKKIADTNSENYATTIFINDSSYESGTATSFKTAMNGVQLVYELATPQTYQLTPQQINTLIGQNNVWNNTNGQTEVEYFIPIE